jgi:hypothetical protein
MITWSLLWNGSQVNDNIIINNGEVGCWNLIETMSQKQSIAGMVQPVFRVVLKLSITIVENQYSIYECHEIVKNNIIV